MNIIKIAASQSLTCLTDSELILPHEHPITPPPHHSRAAVSAAVCEGIAPAGEKPLLYVYRVLLTGIWLMRTSEVEANLVTLNETFRLPYLHDLIPANSPDRSCPLWMMQTWPSTKASTNASEPNSKLRTMPARCARCRRKPRGRR